MSFMKKGDIAKVTADFTNAHPAGCFIYKTCKECPDGTAGDSCASTLVHAGETLLVTEIIGPAHNHNPGLVLVLCNGELRSIYSSSLELVGATE